MKDEDVTVVNGIITRCVYDISTKGNIIEIPDVLHNQMITGIGDYAFSVAGKIAVLTLPSTLKTIGNGVFEGHALTSLDIPAGVISIGYRAFYGNAISSINLPNGLVTIGDGAFENNQLNSILLPGGLKTIGYSAFRNNKIISLTIPNSLESLGSSAFENNIISTLSFQSECLLKEIPANCFYNNDIKNLTTPNSVLIIKDYAFSNNRNLNSVTLSANLLKIKRGAFYFCNLSSISLPGSLVFIGRYAFEGNFNLGNIKLPVSANNYKWNDSNGDIQNEGALVTNKSYSYVARIPYTLKVEDVVVENGVITSCSYFLDITHLASLITIPEKLDGQNITGIGNGVFYDCGISEIVLPAGIKNIENHAFPNNEIISLNLLKTLETIGENAFTNNCLNSLTFETQSQIEKIGMYAFASNRLVKIDFPQSLFKIEKYAFESNFLQKITFEENSQLLSIGSGAFRNNWGLLNFILPDPKVNGYEHWLDWDDKKYNNNLIVTNFESFYKIPIEYTLTDADVEVVNGVIISYNPGNPYANILNIPEIIDGQEIIGIGGGVFRNFGLIGVDLPAYLKIIDYSAFADNDILRVTIPASVEEIRGQAFYMNNINELIFEDNSMLWNIGWGAFLTNRISSLILPDYLKHIEGYAFAYNRISIGITVPDGVEYIGWNAFSGNFIPQLIFGENSNLSYLGPYAFAGNIISNEIFIPQNLTEISDYAFRDNNISKVITHNGIVEYGNGVFENNYPSLTIILHKPPTIPYVTHFFGWKDNDGIYYNPGEKIPDFGNRYKAVIDQYFVVKFKVVDDNNEPVEDASIDFYNSILSTNVNGIDSIGPVMRGIQNYEISAAGCFEFSGSVDVQDDMTIIVTLTRYYKVEINIVDENNKPIGGAELFFDNSNFNIDTNGKITFNLPDGNYPIVINSSGYKESSSTFTVLDADTSIIVQLQSVIVNYFSNGGTGVDFSETTDGSNYVITENLYTRTAYTFSHWNTNPDNSGMTYTENESITLGYSDIDLYAIWTPVNYNITYHLNGGINHTNNPTIYNIESDINLLAASKPSLYFATWLDADSNRVNKIEKGTTGDIELWAVFTPEPTYFIDYFNLENASHNNHSFYTKFDLPLSFTNAYKKGYEFLAWYEDSLLTKQITTIPAGSAKNYEIYAKWGGLIEYSITYNLDGGQNNSSNPDNYTIESNPIVFESPTKAGANFDGWYSDIALTNRITGIPAGSIGDTTLFAKWELDVFEIEYVLNGGVNNIANPGNYTIDSSPITFESPIKTGAGFMGWYSDSSFDNEITGIPTGSIGDTILYAKWELDIFNIDYVLNGGINDPVNPDTYTIETDT
ncbi:MAG: leucine-rich repeat protein, partial [Mariniphaga sp.]|nr:leucine-rich repeat protein [Mariniphaga sp.]